MYKGVCKAVRGPIVQKGALNRYLTLCHRLQVAEFELNASTLRTNSSAMTLSKNIFMRSMSDVFLVLQDFRPRPRPDIPEQVEKRMKKWARAKKGERKCENTWEAVNHLLGRKAWDSEALHEREAERVRERTREALEMRVESRKVALENENKVPLWSTRVERLHVFVWWLSMDNIHERDRSQEEKKRVDTKARVQLRELGVIEAGRKESAPEERLWGGQLELVSTNLWGDGWLKRAEDEFEWMKKDQTKHVDEWGKFWPRTQLWWDEDVLQWAERWRWRNDVIEAFQKTSASLLLELEKIDGSASAREFIVFSASETIYDSDRCRHLTHHIADMKIALVAGDESRFVRNCTAALDLIGGVLRSKGVKQGACYSAICELHTINARYHHTRSGNTNKKARPFPKLIHGLCNRRYLLFKHHRDDTAILIPIRRQQHFLDNRKPLLVRFVGSKHSLCDE